MKEWMIFGPIETGITGTTGQGRFVLLEHIVEGKKVKDIALEMDVAESTVKTHLKRSLKYLREHLSFILFSV
ncbi:MAG: RNA polymerase sigma factor [Butyricimonas faecihominis]